MRPYNSYSCIFVKNDSIDVEHLDSSIQLFLMSLEAKLLEISTPLLAQGKGSLSVVITCGYTQRRDSSGKLTSSLHNVGKAVDLSIYNKDRQLVHENWTKSNWTILKSVIQPLNARDRGQGSFQLIFESTEQSDLNEARQAKAEVGEDSNFIVLSKTNEFYTAPHFHIQYKEGSSGSNGSRIEFSLPEEIVDKPLSSKSNTPVKSTHLNFFYDGPNIRLYDLIRNHPVFRSYLLETGELNESKVSHELMEYTGTEGRGLTNFEELLNQWVSTESKFVVFLNELGGKEVLTKDDFQKRYYSENSSNVLVKEGSTIKLPPQDSNFLTTLVLENGVRNQVSYFENFPAFLSEKRRLMESDPEYLPVVTSSKVDYVFPEFTVWAYSHRLGSVINISPYCKNVIITSPMGGFNSATINLSFVDTDPIWERDLSKTVQNKSKPSLFSQVFAAQSLIWIRFESLNCETFGNTRVTTVDQGLVVIPFSELPNKYYDFIGFIDNIYEVQNTSTSVYNVTLTAFSLDWALELDKSIFMPLALVINNTGSGNIGLLDSSNRLMRRLSSQGEFLQLSQKKLYTFEEVIKFYFGQIVQVGFADDEIFSEYKDRRSTLFEFYPNELRDTVREVPAKGIYQIFKVEIDNYLKGRYFSDRNIALPNGSVYSLIKNICVSPLVELFSDVYGDTYHLIIRKPPFDYSSIKQYLDKIKSEPNEFNTIKTTDVLSTELKWEDNFYTWFQIIPEGATPSVGEYINLLFQIIFVDDYVKTWGSRGLQFSDPYLRDIEADQLNNFSETKAQIISDFIYILESHIYLPFTRKGRIVLNKGDRRFKKGTWIKYEPTNELFYVEKVDQKISVSSQTVSRQTILTVSRGLRIEFIHPPKKLASGTEHLYSYFGILFLENLKEKLTEYINDPSGHIDLVMEDFHFDKDTFEFFLHKLHFVNEYSFGKYFS